MDPKHSVTKGLYCIRLHVVALSLWVSNSSWMKYKTYMTTILLDVSIMFNSHLRSSISTPIFIFCFLEFCELMLPHRVQSLYNTPRYNTHLDIIL